MAAGLPLHLTLSLHSYLPLTRQDVLGDKTMTDRCAGQSFCRSVDGSTSNADYNGFVRHCDFQFASRYKLGGGPRVVVTTTAFQARVRGSVPGSGGLKETKNVSSPSTCESQYCGEPP